MNKKNNMDVLDLMTKFKQHIIENKPSYHQMLQEVRMMKFKVRPVQGDVAFLNLTEKDFIEVLWRLGKLDEFFHAQVKKVAVSQKDTFYRLFDDLYKKYQEDLNKINLKTDEISELPVGFEMEIYKEASSKPN